MFQPKFLNIEAVYYKIYLFLKGIGLYETVNGQEVFTGFHLLRVFQFVLILVSVFSTFMIIDFLHRLFILRREEMTQALQAMLAHVPTEVRKNQRWEEVTRLAESDNESDWKLAVIESDKMLDDLLVLLGYQGETLGDRLLKVEKGDMQSLDDAWEAHKYRNKIAHESGFQVSQREVRRILTLYGNVFREYQFI